MKQDKIKEESYKGFNIKIYIDEDYNETPDDYGVEDQFLVAFHREISIERKGFDKYICSALIGGNIHDEDDEEEAEKIKKTYYYFAIEAYVHSNIHLSLSGQGNYPDRRWDVSKVGVVFIEKDIVKDEKEAEERAKSLLEEWNYHLNGEIYGYVIEKDNNLLDSCWGFVGDTEQPIEEAKNYVDNFVYLENKKKQKKLKAYINNKIPLEKRFV
jgi:hypothetical protein